MALLTEQQRRWLRREARTEAEAANEEARVICRATGEWNDRDWVHPDEWARMRSAIVVLVGALRLDGVIKDEEKKVVEAFIDRWLGRSFFAGCYTEPKRRQLARLWRRLSPGPVELDLCAKDCSDKLSIMQKNTLAESLDAIAASTPAELRPRLNALRDLAVTLTLMKRAD